MRWLRSSFLKSLVLPLWGCLAFAAFSGTASAASPSVSDFYEGKTVRIIVGLSPGGSFDTIARALARHLPKYVPGSPEFRVENMPGAGSMLALNTVYNKETKDGTVIGMAVGSTFVNQLFGRPGVDFDATKLNYLGNVAPFMFVLIANDKSGVTDVTQLLPPNASKKMVLAAGGIGEASLNLSVLFKDVLGANVDIKSGYPGSSQSNQAVFSGEADGKFISGFEVQDRYADMLNSGELKIIAQWTAEPHPAVPGDIPTILSFAQDDESRLLLRMGGLQPNLFLFPMFMAPEVPEERVAALQEAYVKVFEDDDFLADLEKGKVTAGLTPGPELKQIILDYFSIPEATKTRLKEIIYPESN